MQLCHQIVTSQWIWATNDKLALPLRGLGLEAYDTYCHAQTFKFCLHKKIHNKDDNDNSNNNSDL